MKKSHGTIVLCMLGLIILVGLIAYTVSEREAAYEYVDEGRWIVEEGDTLWEIAKEYSDNRHDIRRVIHIIRYECNNNISPDIYPGQVVYVPLFECMDWPYYEEVE